MPYSITSGNPLTEIQRTSAHNHLLTLSPTPGNGRWDLGVEYRPPSPAGDNDIFTIQLTAGSTISIHSESSSSPTAGLVIYDQNAVPVARENDAYYGYLDKLSDFVAPYTGLYYINALWSPAAHLDATFIRVWVDLPRDPTEGNDELGGRSVLAAGGHDTIMGTIYEDFIRGGEGDDLISGSSAFDDLHGNQGADTIEGGLGYDWVVGGQGDDLLYGDGSSAGLSGDIVLGNLGDDTLYGSYGPDILRGGQGNDTLSGSMDNDFLSGDRGDDTMEGGSGADTFHTFAGAGIDRILDFSFSGGDRVMFETPGTAYTLRQVGADAVIDLGGGAQMILVGVNSATLPAGWLVTS